MNEYCCNGLSYVRYVTLHQDGIQKGKLSPAFPRIILSLAVLEADTPSHSSGGDIYSLLRVSQISYVGEDMIQMPIRFQKYITQPRKRVSQK